MTVEKPKPKQLLRPITTGAGSAMNQSQFLAIICNWLQAREKSRVHGAIGFGFASHWLKNWRESFKPITKRSNRDHVITFDSHLKTALTQMVLTTRKLPQNMPQTDCSTSFPTIKLVLEEFLLATALYFCWATEQFLHVRYRKTEQPPSPPYPPKKHFHR